MRLFIILWGFGLVFNILSDQGKNYQADLTRRVLEMLDIHQLRTTPYQPECDGLSERFNRTLQAMLRCFVDDNQSNWDELLPYLSFAYNTSVHAVTNLTPYEILFGRPPKVPLDLVLGSRLSLNAEGYAQIRTNEPVQDQDEYRMRAIAALPEADRTHEYADQLKERLHQVYEHVVKTRGGKVAKTKLRYDRKLRPTVYQVGDLVYYLNKKPEKHKAKKLLPKWVGPYEIVAVLSELTYRIKHALRASKPRTVHHNNLKRYFGPEPQVRLPQGNASQLDNESIVPFHPIGILKSPQPVSEPEPQTSRGTRGRGRPRIHPEKQLPVENPTRVGKRVRFAPDRLNYA